MLISQIYFVLSPVSSRIAALFWLEHLQPCLQVVCYEQVSQTIPRGGTRSQIAIPAQGMIEFRDVLTELLDEFGTDDQGQSLGLMQVVVIHYASFDCLVARFKKKRKKRRRRSCVAYV